MYLYKSSGDTPIGCFDMANRTNDLRYLVVGWDRYADIEVPKGADDLLKDLNEQWIKIADDNEVRYYLQLKMEVIELKTRYEIVAMILTSMITNKLNEDTFVTFKNVLRTWRYKWNDKKPKFQELQRLIRQHKASKNKLSLKEDELKSLNERYSDLSENKGLEWESAILEQNLNKDRIDIWTTSMDKWANYIKLSVERAKNLKKANGK